MNCAYVFFRFFGNRMNYLRKYINYFIPSIETVSNFNGYGFGFWERFSTFDGFGLGSKIILNFFGFGFKKRFFKFIGIKYGF